MAIEIPAKLDDLNLSPEAYRLYIHLCRLGGEVNKPLIDILNHCQIPYACSDLSVGKFFMELHNRHLIDFEIKGCLTREVDIVLTRVTFLPVEEWA